MCRSRSPRERSWRSSGRSGRGRGVTLGGGGGGGVVRGVPPGRAPGAAGRGEPPAGLDRGGARAWGRLVRGRGGGGRAIVAARGDPAAVPAVADRVAWLEQG